MKTESVNFTDDLISGFCEESGTNVALMKKMYHHYSSELSKKVKSSPEVIEAPIRHFGTLYQPLHGVIILAAEKKRILDEGRFPENKEYNQQRLDFYEKRKEVIKKRIDKCRECGIKNVKFMKPIRAKRYIKNA